MDKVTEVCWGNVMKAAVGQCDDLVFNATMDWQPVKILKMGSNVM